MTQERRQYSILSLLTGITVLACVMSVFWSGHSRAAFVTSLLTLFALTLAISIRNRAELSIASLLVGPLLAVGFGGLIAAVDPMVALPEDRFGLLYGVLLIGLISGIAAAWLTLFGTWLHTRN